MHLVTKDPSLQPKLREGKRRLAAALRRKTDDLAALAKGTGHKLCLFQPDWATWPRRGKAKTKARGGTLITCARCHRISNAGWDTPCIGEKGARTGAQRALWARIAKASGPNVANLLKIWGADRAQVDKQMFKSLSVTIAEKHGHQVVWFTPHWASWAAVTSSQLAKANSRLLTCTSCLRTSGGDWARECKGSQAANKSKIRAQWCNTSTQNRRLLLKLWGLTKDQVEARLGLRTSLALRNHKRAKLVWDGIEPHPGPGGSSNVRLLNLNVGGAIGAWALLKEGHILPFDVVLLQELTLKDSEWQAYSRHAAKRGFAAYYQPGNPTRDGWGNTGPQLDLSSFQLRSKRKTLARACELGRLLRERRPGTENAIRNLAGKLQLAEPSCRLTEALIRKLSGEVQQQAKAEKQRALTRWRQRLISEPKALGRWLQSKAGCAPHSLKAQDGQLSFSALEGAAFIRNYWRQFWQEQERDRPADDEVLRTLQAGIPAPQHEREVATYC